MMHNIACVFAQGFARAQAEQNALAAEYRGRSLEAVGRTLQMVRPEERSAFWQDKIVTDAALAPLRGDVEFKRLGDEYGRR
jgi:hypothetical protein